MLALYAFFEKVVVNYRPVILEGTLPEASFPSSHTMLACVVFGSAAMILPLYVKNSKLRRVLEGLCCFIMGFTVGGRLLSGVHWLTDIVGGVLISLALLALFSAAAEKLAGSEKES